MTGARSSSGNPRTFHLTLLLAVCVIVAFAGCIGPRGLSSTRLKYNEAIRRTNDAETLLALVRLRYQDTNVRLAVSNITSQFEASAGARYEGGDDELGVANVAVSDRPTIVYSPAGAQTVEEVAAPLTLEQLEFLSSTFSLGTVLRMFVGSINGLDNASTAVGPTPSTPPRFEEFRCFAEIASELQNQQAILLKREKRPAEQEYTLPLKSADDFLKLRQAGYDIQETESGNELIVRDSTISPVLVLRQEPETIELSAQLQQLLGLDGNVNKYQITSVPEQFPSTYGPTQRDNIEISLRSLGQVSLFLSQGIEVPERDINCGAVRTTCNHDGSLFDWNQVLGNLFHVRCCKRKPRNARLAVKYRGYWFYVMDCDKATIETLRLLTTVSGLQGVRAGRDVNAPVLTISAGR